MKLRYDPSALADLEEIYDFIATDDHAAALVFRAHTISIGETSDPAAGRQED